MNAVPELAVVVPVKNEADNILPLVTEIHAALHGVVEFEIIYVDDGSTDATGQKLLEAKGRFPQVRFVRHRASCGQSQAIATAVKHARAPLIAMLDGDGQNDPADIPSMLARWRAEPEASREKLLIAGWRANRKDTSSRRWASKAANAIRAWALRDNTPDTGCGSKLFSRALFLDLPRFDHMHRYLPALTIRAGGTVESVVVNHRPRGAGASNYSNLRRALVGVPDLLGVMWLMRRSRNPVVEIPPQ
ncbi:glycosyltransferase family 2 protein [Magnetospirillum gryphiswaldense]|uniref:Glycosyl transferase, group 2 family protein n=2 Tax=Magnetospirillum gryphiswaldense TaxID=55518 RepID=V6F3Z2_MAGGM|nr:glycosyltransferase family 2 protein [Magnetospirillum gryphiswaldense]AVM75782.1 Undecaprenyl-phosphate 4-deoxy-4-formamido-L-arabinose transferase [Magnetospirillum gryphiswaldense MSR-1]AVM79685.1 Undecaprenyl-phosphate 4-deoxy-4-formamido-L-arabinose transferase [Magnetospirillum gryphiswaldense]CAM74818.1 glycosyl transferase, group 2 family protein [Magnetospirillum gryphiswaldense MSR-1]CDL00240.1 Glycosyl transferase, group 2 family protein [Magnetospirillum gryphiswaldense MSR-1 v2]